MNPSQGLSTRTVILKFVLTTLVGFPAFAFGSTDFVVPPGRQAEPSVVIVGPDHNLWFTEFTGEKIGRITTGGTVTEFKIAGAQSLVGITTGPDGDIWFTDQFTGKVGHVNTSGGQLKEYSFPSGSYPQGITVGPDGNLWCVVQKKTGMFTIAKITVAGAITEYSGTVSAGSFQPYIAVGQIVTGPDGNLWFTNPQAASTSGSFVGQITPAGAVHLYSTSDVPQGIVSGPDGNLWTIESGNVARITTSGVETEFGLSFGGTSGITVGGDGNLWFTEFTTLGSITTGGALTEYPTTTFANFGFPWGIAAGPDGNLWFTGLVSSNIGELSTAGILKNTYALNNGSGPAWDTLGPDGAVWFTDVFSGQIGRISTTGSVTLFAIETPNSGPEGIVAGPDGNLWFTEQRADQIGKITTSGVVTEYSLGGGHGLWGITAGPDGNLWFTEFNPLHGNKIGRITPAGTITEFPIPTQAAFPFFITPGPDGNLWFTENAASKVAKIDPGTGNITEYSIGANKGPYAITAGPDGNLWFLENTPPGEIAAISTSGTLIAEYPVSIGESFPEGVVVGSDGALWLNQEYPNSTARVTTEGVVSEVALNVTNGGGNDLTVGADGKIWVVDIFAGDVSRFSAIGGTGKLIKPALGKEFNGAVAKFVDGTPAAESGDFIATINWGDGSEPSPGDVTGATGGPFTVTGSHTYTQTGTFKTAVSLHDNVDDSTYAASKGTAEVN